MFCFKCGKKLTDNAKFCWACGEKAYIENDADESFSFHQVENKRIDHTEELSEERESKESLKEKALSILRNKVSLMKDDTRYIKTNFLNSEYSIPNDVITYIDLVEFTDNIKQQLINAFVRKLNASSTGCIDNKDLDNDILSLTNRFIAKLCDLGIYNRTANDYLINSKGYEIISEVNSEALGKAKEILLRHINDFESGFNAAVARKEASVTGMGFSIWTNSFTNYAIYAAMEASTLKKQEKAAAMQYQSEIQSLNASLDAKYDSEQKNYISSVYIPHMEMAITVFAYELLDKYIADLISNEKFNGEALEYVNIKRSNDLLNSLRLSNNKKAILQNAFKVCPYNPEVYFQCVKYRMLSSEEIETATVFNQHSELEKHLYNEFNRKKNKKNTMTLQKDLTELENTIDTLCCCTGKHKQEYYQEYVDWFIKEVVEKYKTIGMQAESVTYCDLIITKIEKTRAIETISEDGLRAFICSYLSSVISNENYEFLIHKCGCTDLLEKITSQKAAEAGCTSKKELDKYYHDRIFAHVSALAERKKDALQEEAAQKEEAARKLIKVRTRKKRIIIVCLASLLILALGFCVYTFVHKKAQRSAFEGMMQEMYAEIPLEFPSLLAESLESENYINNIECSFDSGISFNSNYDWYDWEEYAQITIYIDDVFDSWSESEQYEYIDRVGNKAKTSFIEILKEQYPDRASVDVNWEAMDELGHELYGAHICYDSNYDVFFKTSINTYECAFLVDDYFIKNGEEVYLHNKNSIYTSGSSIYSQYCIVDGCSREGTTTYTNPLSGKTEYYCKKHYDEMMGYIESFRSTYCGMDGCQKEGTETWINFSGIPEYYCKQHYNDLMDALDYFGY